MTRRSHDARSERIGPPTMTGASARRARAGRRARCALAAPPKRKTAALHAAAAAIRDRGAERSSPPTPATSPRPRRSGLVAGAARPAGARPEARRGDGRRASRTIAALPDPVGRELARLDAAERARHRARRVPLGVIGIIYESRPNVTADAGGLCLKSGNAAILRGGSESFHSSRAHRRGAARRACARPACPRPRSSWCRRATAPRSA